jgi:hypothetical protein
MNCHVEWTELMGKDIRFQRCRESPDPDAVMAEVGTIVKCNLVGYFYSIELEKRLIEEPFEVLNDVYIQIGEGDVIPGLELPLRHSKVGERLRCIVSSKFAFGTTGRCTGGISAAKATTEDQINASDGLAAAVVIRKRHNVAIVPPNTAVDYEVEVLAHLSDRELHPDIVTKYHNELTAPAHSNEQQQQVVHRLLTIQMMTYRKDAGNRWFSYDEFSRAAKAYSQATKLAETYFNSSGTSSSTTATGSLEERIQSIEQQEQAKQALIAEEDIDIVGVYVTCLNNLAACKVSQGEFVAAKELCVKVLQFSPLNVKALLRAAKSTLALHVSCTFRHCHFHIVSCCLFHFHIVIL